MATRGTSPPPGTHRYLSQGEKHHTLHHWDQIKGSDQPGDGRVRGGRGFPDPDIVPWCDRLNALPGVCTVQSCAGHTPEETGGGFRSGHLWLLLDEEMSTAFDARALELAAQEEHIERVSRIYAPWGQEVTSITFAGNERGLLDESMRIVLEFFLSLERSRIAGS